MNPNRNKLARKYIVFHLKLTELLHLILLNLHLREKQLRVENVLGHDVDQFRETLLGAAVNAYMAIADNPRSTNAQSIFIELYPRYKRSILRIWERYIAPGEVVMKAYRDRAGVHGDKLEAYFGGKMGLFRETAKVLKALQAFRGIAANLLKKLPTEHPNLADDVEAVLLDVELGFEAQGIYGHFDRRWLRRMRLIESGPYRKVFT